MATMEPSLLSQLQAHLQRLESDPTTPLDSKLFESSSLVLTQSIPKDASVSVITRLSTILPTLQTDPTPVIQFLIQLLQPYTFSDILSLNAGIDFVAGLDERALPYNRLMLTLLHKATASATDASAIAARPEVVAALVKLWLCTQDAGIAQEAGGTLLGLLKADQQSPPGSGQDPLPAHSQGLMWKRVFGDQDIYGLMFSMCSLRIKDERFELPKSQRTLAQARLLEWLPTVGLMNWNAITKNHHPSVESQYTNGKGQGLLFFATACMVDVKDDVLMHRCLIEFFGDLISKVKSTEQASSAESSASLDFLIKHGLHDHAMSFYLDPSNPRHDPLDLQFVYAPSAKYLAAYASNYPGHFLSSTIKDKTLMRLKQSLDLSPSRWAHAESPKHDLHILASVPRISLLPTSDSSSWSTSPLSLLPSRSTNADILDTLSTIFCGPVHRAVITYPPRTAERPSTDMNDKSEAQAARALYYFYLNHNPRLFEDLVKHAETIALESHALAAVNLITSIAIANWQVLPDEASGAPSSLPTEGNFISWLPNPPTATPSSGVLALLAPPSLEHTLPYLLKPPQTFSNIVGGLGDTENSAYKVAMAKFDALKVLSARLEDKVLEEPGQGYEEIVATLRRRIADGPWGRQGQGQVGSSIATMEL